MSAITNLSSQQLRYIADVKEKIDSLQEQLNLLLGVAASNSSARRKSRMSVSARARIAAAQRARWAKVKGSAKPRRELNAAARAKMAALARTRWAKARAAGKTRL
jgi:hypothetical protein